MNMLSRTVLSAAAILVGTTSIAFAAGKDECLPVSTIASAKFVRAVNAPDQPEIWGLITPNFEFNKDMWNIIFVAKMNDVSSAEEALSKGQNMFNSVSLSEPVPGQLGEYLICDYGSVDNEYAVIASKPPIAIPEEFKKAKFSFK
jgi:hypothetical protein